jgi:hypothetical protein
MPYFHFKISIRDNTASKAVFFVLQETKTKRMQSQFSPALISKCQKIIFKRSGKKISKEKAELYLDKFASLMMTAVKIFEKKEKTKNDALNKKKI